MDVARPLAVEVQDARRIVLAGLRRGLFLYSRNDLLGRFLDALGEWAEAELDLLLPLLRPGDRVVDAGANIGLHAIPFAHAVGPTGRVHAFEPQRVIHGLLSANAVLNGADALRAHLAALGEAPGRIAVPEVDYRREALGAALSLSGTPVLATEAAPAETVPVVTLDAMLAEEPSLRLIKADVEGMERSVIAGARALIARHRPFLYLEVNDHPGGEALIALVRELGYRAFWHPSRGWRPDNFRRAPDPGFGEAGDLNALCVPPEEEASAAGLVPVGTLTEARTLFPGLSARTTRWERWKKRILG